MSVGATGLPHAQPAPLAARRVLRGRDVPQNSASDPVVSAGPHAAEGNASTHLATNYVEFPRRFELKNGDAKNCRFGKGLANKYRCRCAVLLPR
jgi:hypothetical protein